MRTAIQAATLVFVMGVAQVPSSTWAHHALLVEHWMDRTIAIEGVVTRLTLGYPHVRIYLQVDGEDGAEEWLVEGGSHMTLRRHGWTGKEIAPGDLLRVVGYPGRHTANLVHWKTLRNADGRVVWTERPAP